MRDTAQHRQGEAAGAASDARAGLLLARGPSAAMLPRVPDLSAPVVLALALIAGFAGFVDAIAGGGGLLTLPALLLAGLPPHLALGTNKGQSVFGSGFALARFARSPLFDRSRAVSSALPALAGSAAGVVAVSAVPPRALGPLVMVLLAAAALFFALRRARATERQPVARPAWLAALVALVIGAYDGFFGPGTGTFLIVAYVWLWHDRLDAASANAKVVNFGSNLAAMVAFSAQGLVAWSVALPMAAGQALGGWCGAHLTVRRGQGLVRGVVIAVCMALVLRLAWQIF